MTTESPTPTPQDDNQIIAERRAKLAKLRDARKDKEAKLEKARELGADYVIDVQKEDPLARIREITGGRGVGRKGIGSSKA